MQDTNRQNLEERAITILTLISGVKVITRDQTIGRDIGIDGLDGVEAVEQLEKEFGVDLRPLIDAHRIVPTRTWLDRLCGTGHPHADMTVREVVDYIAGEQGRNQARDSRSPQ